MNNNNNNKPLART